jgi:uncharacterized protein (TIGR00251 family)
MIINVKVFPNSSREEIIRISESNYKVYLKKSPLNNKANIELLKFLKKEFKKPVSIVNGTRSRNKTINVGE